MAHSNLMRERQLTSVMLSQKSTNHASENYLIKRHICHLAAKQPSEAARLNLNIYVVQSNEFPTLTRVLADNILQLLAHISGILNRAK